MTDKCLKQMSVDELLDGMNVPGNSWMERTQVSLDEIARRLEESEKRNKVLVEALRSVFGEWLEGTQLNAGSPQYDLVRKAIKQNQGEQ